jgi:hypothetical protein
MGRACSLLGGEKKNSYTVWLKNVKEGDCLEDVRVDGGIILKWVVLSRLEDCRSALFA